MAVSTLSVGAVGSLRSEVVLLDTVSDTLSYVGKAAPKSTTSSPVWQIRRIATTGSVLTVDYADGDDRYDNVWDNRAGLSYS